MFRRKNKKKRYLSTQLIPDSVSSEQIRFIRIRLDQILKDKPALIMVTSPEDMEQKATISSSLAIAFAEQGKKVLLVDANIENPAVHHLFRINNSNGLTNVIAAEEDLKGNIKETFIPGLFLLPVGSLSVHASEFWVTSKFEKFSESCREEFDIVLFEVPALLTVSDPLILANQCDGSILVVEANKTKLDSALKTKEYLDRSKSEILGVIYQTG